MFYETGRKQKKYHIGERRDVKLVLFHSYSPFRWHSTTSHAYYKSYVALSLRSDSMITLLCSGPSTCKLHTLLLPDSLIRLGIHRPRQVACERHMKKEVECLRVRRNMPVLFHNENFYLLRNCISAIISAAKVHFHWIKWKVMNSRWSTWNQMYSEQKKNSEKWQCWTWQRKTFARFPSLARSFLPSIPIQLFWRHIQMEWNSLAE